MVPPIVTHDCSYCHSDRGEAFVVFLTASHSVSSMTKAESEAVFDVEWSRRGDEWGAVDLVISQPRSRGRFG